MRLIEYPDAEMMAIDLAQSLAGELTSALDHEDRVLFIVPGGSTPGSVFDDLCDADLDWSRVDVLASDERWVPEVHVRSNARMIRERLLTGRASAARQLPMFVKGKAPDAVLAELEANIVPLLPAAVCLLGMGDDMHTASLFPGADNLEAALDRHAPVLVAMNAPGAPEPRVTLSARVINQALAKHIVITGSSKRAALDRARHLPPMKAPVAAVLENAVVHWSV